MAEINFVEELRHDFPRLYPPELPYYMISVRPGWERIVRELSQRLRDEPVVCLQVKEKLGGLHWYFEGSATPTVRAAVIAAEAASWITCDRCGEPGRLVERQCWFMVRCPDHAGDGVPVDPQRRTNLPVSVGLYAPRQDDVARGFITIDELPSPDERV